MVEHGHQIGEAFVESECIGRSRRHKIGPKPIQERVCDLVRHHVVRERRERAPMGQITALHFRGSVVVSKTKSPILFVVVRVLLKYALGTNLQLSLLAGSIVESPIQLPAKRHTERLADAAAHGVRHLLAKLW